MTGAYLKSEWQNFKALKGRERIFFLLTIPVIVASLFSGSEVFKLGFRLPRFLIFGDIPGIQPRIYLFEIYIFLSFLLFLGPAILELKALIQRKKKFSELWWLAFVLFFFGMCRLLLPWPQNFLLALRNSAFIWYLALPLYLAFVNVSQAYFEFVAKVAIYCVFSVFIFSLVIKFFPYYSSVLWIPQIGIYAILWRGERSKFLDDVLAACLGLGMAFSYLEKFQRTTLVGLFLVMVLLLLQKRFRKGVLRSLAIASVVFLSFIFIKMEKSKEAIANSSENFSLSPLIKSESNSLGMEIFRTSMWRDAFHLFRENPIVGVGFEAQVVQRVFRGTGVYVPNNIFWFKSPTKESFEFGIDPPISGPHNSYLNALARIGFMGILLFILHFGVLVKLTFNENYHSAFVFFAGFLYAFFNVGLEGPSKSAMMLILMSSALAMNFSRQSFLSELSSRVAQLGARKSA